MPELFTMLWHCFVHYVVAKTQRSRRGRRRSGGLSDCFGHNIVNKTVPQHSEQFGHILMFLPLGGGKNYAMENLNYVKSTFSICP